MKKKWIISATLAGLIAVPLMGFSSAAPGQAKIQPNQITLESGGTSVPLNLFPSFNEPVDGIISGTAGCQPDVHEFDKSQTTINPYTHKEEPGHIVFTAGITEFGQDRSKAVDFDSAHAKIYVEIISNGQTVQDQALYLHPGVDPNTGKPFFVTAVMLNGENAANLPTGEYNYQFKAKDDKGRVLAVWAPKDHKFTITDSSAGN